MIPSGHETYYDMLKISSDSSKDEIKGAYLSLAKETHPDATGNSENAEFIRIKEAFEILSDPDKKKSYDWFVKNKRHSYDKETAARTKFEESTSILRNSASASASAYAAGNTAKSSEYLEAQQFRQQLRNKFPRNEKERIKKLNARKVPLRPGGSLGFVLLPILLTGAWAYGGYRMS